LPAPVLWRPPFTRHGPTFLGLGRVLDKSEHLSRCEGLVQNCKRSACLRPSGYRGAWLALDEKNGNAVAAAPKIFEKFDPAQPARHVYVDDEAIVTGSCAVGEEGFHRREILYGVTRRLQQEAKRISHRGVIIDDEDHLCTGNSKVPMWGINRTIRIDLNQRPGEAQSSALYQDFLDRYTGIRGTIA
jgi:hypothetical protein